ncbi:enoyl-CoA hydratase/isomerase family protein [Streptomyces canus]|uniref:enoyl-CoA hydratase/isomerase family protein n=1 Tax=Streptomyces canus TaxID=58343 RepID=UPI002E2979E5|nr:enoyl-CoA hydratase/isomerase family protein [Streptomyces canus]
MNLVIPESVVTLHRIVKELENDPDIQVVVFSSELPDFFINHYDGATTDPLPQPEHEDDNPVWIDMVLRLSKAPFVSIAAIRGRSRGAGNELALACDLRYASREKAFFSQPEVGMAIVPGGGGGERLPRSIGRDRALEAILTSADYDADLAERWGWVTRALPDAELDAFVDATVTRLASFDRQALAIAKSMVNRATLPPDADLVTSFGEFADIRTQPGFAARAVGLGALAAEKGLDVQYQMGEYIGLVNENL